ncbi:hypothetical protein Lepto7376_1731 [[Leptolyngbya] sp. PCC 7376]|uniref:hypothetical protein n=1 Tax=[Leptolyngbya] sp. PCC 7376 TaxID=111781 RepID=UPI00029EDAFD|nr:hypothetical protein [[Leptolyngbya] sp. PCC 7376]AFY38065.1 hypothetical protein Lepto7376_1731 [[Leptolyngbya] sp. PCC 7376]
MSFQTLLETALRQNFITPETQAIIAQCLWTDEVTQQQLNLLQVVVEKLESGKMQVVAS